MAKGSDKKRKSTKTNKKQKGTQSPQMKLGTIWDAFYKAERMLLGEEAPLKKRFYGESEEKAYIFSFPASAQSEPKQKCQVTRPTQETCFDMWVPDFIQRYFGTKDEPLSETHKNIMTGNGLTSTTSLQRQLEDRTLQIFTDWLNYLEKVLQMHIKVVVCLKNNSKIDVSLSKEKNWTSIDVLVRDVDEEIQTKWNDEYEYSLKVFKQQLITGIIESDDFKNDNRIKNTQFNELIVDESRDEIERLTILSVFCLLAGRSIDGEEYFFKKLCKNLYDETGKLKQKPVSLDTSDQIKVNEETIRAAGQRWYDETKKIGSRFSRLIPRKELMPLAGLLPINARVEKGEEKPLMETIRSTKGHLYLVGEGGIGKTTALYSIMKEAYGEGPEKKIHQIPLYVELSKAANPDDFDLKKRFSLYIRHTLQRQIQKTYSYTANIEAQLEKLFCEETEEPQYILLLDGLNEVSREELDGNAIISMVINEIRYIMTQYTNVRVILTSRSKENLGGKATSLYLSGIEPEMVEWYLSKREVSKERIQSATHNPSLMELLRIPLFLVLYAELKGDEEMLSRGEILHAFFAQTREGLYSERGRRKEIREQLLDEENIEMSEASVTPPMLSFMLDFVMPEIAWHMVKSDAFQITQKEIEIIVREVLTNKKESSWCGEKGRNCFSEYRTKPNEHTWKVAQRIERTFGTEEDEKEKWEEIAAKICECLSQRLGVLFSDDFVKYEVVHPHIRDYFAALYHINKLKLAVYSKGDLARECLKEWREDPLPLAILTFIGEALGEKHNTPRYDEEKKKWEYVVPDPKQDPCERNLIKRAFEIYRHRFDDKDGYAVWNLFQILKLTREDLSGEDFSYLDLTKCRANGYRLGNKGFAAIIKGSLLNGDFFMPQGHYGGSTVYSAQFSPKGKHILTGSSDDTFIVWDTKTRQIVPGGVFMPGGSFVTYNHDGSRIMSILNRNDHTCTIKIWDAHTIIPKVYKEPIISKDFSGNIAVAAYSRPECNRIVMSFGAGVLICDADSLSTIIVEPIIMHKSMVTSVEYSPDGKNIVTASLDGTAVIRDAEKLLPIQHGILNDHTAGVASAHYDSTGKYIVTTSYDGTIKLWDVEEKPKLLKSGVLNCEFVQSAQFSPDGKYIAITSNDQPAELWSVEEFKKVPGIKLTGRGNILRGRLTEAVCSLDFSSDGKYIVTSSYNGDVRLWDAKTFQIVPDGVLPSQKDQICSVHFSPDRQNIIMACVDGTAKIWDTDTCRLVPCGVLKGHKDIVSSANYSPRGDRIVTCSWDGTAKVWDAQTSEELSELIVKGEKTVLTSIEYITDSYIVAFCMNGSGIIWNAATYDPIDPIPQDVEDLLSQFNLARQSVAKPGDQKKVSTDAGITCYDSSSWCINIEKKDENGFSRFSRIVNVPGVELWNVDFTTLNPDSVISGNICIGIGEFLKSYGAKVD